MTKKLLMGALAGLVTSFSVECIKAYVSLTKLEALVISIFIVVVVYKICELAVAHMNWKMAARAGGVELQAYKDPEAFVAGMSTLSKDTPIYIDSDLGNDIKGENIAKDLHEKGFTNLTMATGYGPEKFIHLPWLKVTGKEPPFGK